MLSKESLSEKSSRIEDRHAVQQPFHVQLADRARDLSARLVRFGREFTDDLDTQELERMFDEDAVRAFTVLAGEKPESREESLQENLRIVLLQTKAFFLGLAFKLSPARRLLFATSLALPVGGLVFGALDVGIGVTRIAVDFSPLWFLTSIAGLTMLLALELVDRIRVRDELDVARELQSELLPGVAPRPEGYEIAHSYDTANEIGGDYYDFLELDDGRLVLAVGDASGHGIGAGLLMAISNAALKTALDLDPSPRAVLEVLNRTLCRTGSSRAFMSLFYSVLDPATGELEYACAGHPYPMLRRESGEVVELGEGAMPLGIRIGTTYTSGRVTIEPGDTLVLYSDGVPELIGGPQEDAFGFQRLRSLLVNPGDAQTVHDRILGDVKLHLGGRRLSDDLTLVVVGRRKA